MDHDWMDEVLGAGSSSSSLIGRVPPPPGQVKIRRQGWVMGYDAAPETEHE